MPPSKRKSRKQPIGTRRASDARISGESPQDRAAKRRKTNGVSPREAARPATPDGHGGNGDESEEAMSTAEAQEVADRIIPLLNVAPYPIAVAAEHANDKFEGETIGAIRAYAKICGATWTYYINETNINIGRTPDSSTRQSVSLRAESSPGEGGDLPTIHLDLGPHKHVSRLHSKLFFDSSDAKWYIRVEGRNGLRVNNMVVKRGHQRTIACGDILEIASTQMMFVTAGEKAVIDESFLRKLREETSDDEQVEDGYQHQMLKTQNRTQPSQQPDIGPYASSSTLIAPAPPDFVRPTTPVRSARKSGGVSARSPTVGGAMNMESTEDIDYSLDAYKDFKPTQSYSCMIGRAILSTRDEAMTLNGIYKWISDNFAYYRHNKTNWKNSIRHNLSIHDQFMKIPRRSDEPGKGMKWAIPDNQRSKLIAEINRQQNKGGKHRSRSTPSSPTVRVQDSASFAQVSEVLKSSPTLQSPPLSAYPPTAQESFTPSRGSRVTSLNSHDAGTHVLPTLSSDDPSLLPVRRAHGSSAENLGSSPTLTSGAWLGYDGNSMRTPVPRPHNLNIPLPNTMAKPSSYMPDSSPAPFWKYTKMAAGSTPGLWPAESSPLKPPILPSSSPPPPAANGVGVDSPTKARGSMNLETSGVVIDPDDEEGGIDLAKGFQNISSFHKRRAEAAAGTLIS